MHRNIPGGGLSNKAGPQHHHYCLARNVDISKWYHMCTSYSSTLQRMHMYQNGLKVHSYHFTDEEDLPLPSYAFKNSMIGWN